MLLIIAASPIRNLANNYTLYEKSRLNDNPRPPPFSLQLYRIIKDKLNTQNNLQL